MYTTTKAGQRNMKRIIGLFVVSIAALAIPSTASAWTPEDCAAVHWDHPDCVNIPRPTTTVCVNGVTQEVPADMPPEGSTPGGCVPPPPPAEVTPPAYVPPAVTPVEDVPPVDTPNLTPEVTPKVEHNGKPNEVLGKEQTKPHHNIGTPVSETSPDTQGTTLPFTGSEALWILLAGSVALAGGFGLRRLAQR